MKTFRRRCSFHMARYGRGLAAGARMTRMGSVMEMDGISVMAVVAEVEAAVVVSSSGSAASLLSTVDFGAVEAPVVTAWPMVLE